MLPRSRFRRSRSLWPVLHPLPQGDLKFRVQHRVEDDRMPHGVHQRRRRDQGRIVIAGKALDSEEPQDLLRRVVDSESVGVDCAERDAADSGRDLAVSEEGKGCVGCAGKGFGENVDDG